MKLKGAPQRLDVVLRPLVRIVQVLFALISGAICAYMDWWWWLPLPVAGSFLAYELIFWLRADRPITLELRDSLVLRDPRRRLVHEVRPSEVHVATAFARRSTEHLDLRLQLGSRDGVLLALWLRLPADTPLPPHTVDSDASDALLGGDYGSPASLAPGWRVGRQRIDAPAAALAWFVEHLPPESWERTGLRVWQGVEPELDLLGHHTGDPSAWWVLDGDTLHDGTQTLPLKWGPLQRAERTAVLLHAGRGLDDTFAPEQLVLALFDLGAVRVAAPTRQLAARATRCELDDALFHTHGAEAAALLDHLRRVMPRDAWPEGEIPPHEGTAGGSR